MSLACISSCLSLFASLLGSHGIVLTSLPGCSASPVVVLQHFVAIVHVFLAYFCPLVFFLIITKERLFLMRPYIRGSQIRSDSPFLIEVTQVCVLC